MIARKLIEQALPYDGASEGHLQMRADLDAADKARRKAAGTWIEPKQPEPYKATEVTPEAKLKKACDLWAFFGRQGTVSAAEAKSWLDKHNFTPEQVEQIMAAFDAGQKAGG